MLNPNRNFVGSSLATTGTGWLCQF